MDNEQYKENSKKRLLNNIKKKFDTTIIGSLAAFEEEFGYLWGHGKHYSELTDQCGTKLDRRSWTMEILI